MFTDTTISRSVFAAAAAESQGSGDATDGDDCLKLLHGRARRTGDRLIAAWEKSQGQFSTVKDISKSDLRDNYFLMVADQHTECSVFVDFGDYAADCFGLGTKRFNGVNEIRKPLRDRVMETFQKCAELEEPQIIEGDFDLAYWENQAIAPKFRMVAAPIREEISDQTLFIIGTISSQIEKWPGSAGSRA